MKNHFNTLFNPSHRWWTISFFFVSLLMIFSSFRIGISGNLPSNVLLFFGITLFFVSVVHPWQNWKNYVIMVGLFAGTALLLWMMFYLTDNQGQSQIDLEKWIASISYFVCLPGVVVGILGALLLMGKGKSYLDVINCL
jgi:hypothetical protein